ncbi:MAG: hypothetical protein ACRCZ2_03655 [Fusobacteriaceae bacterium]
MVKIITCASYGGTGSSAITDLLKEFKNCKSFGEFEFNFLHYPKGIRDLELNILNRNNRLNTGYAIFEFLKMNKKIEKEYKKYFGNNYFELTKEYAESLSQVSWKGTSELYTNNQNKFIKLSYQILNKFSNMIKLKKEGLYFQNKNYPLYSCYISKEIFYKNTQNYLEKLFQNLDKEKKNDKIILDQLVPCSDINSYLNYIKDVKVIVVDRDPRDLFILNMEFWNEGWIPQEVNLYVEYFKTIRNHQYYEKENQNKIIRIRFEDLIYSYEETLKKIMIFLELDEKNHYNKNVFFNPEISIKNTNLQSKYKKYEKEISIIEKELKIFCYEGY